MVADWSKPFDAPRLNVQRFREHVERERTHDLASVGFDQADASLIEKAGPCSTCPKRTGAQAALWNEECRDRCLDGDCFDAKLHAHCLAIVETAKANGERPVAITGRSRPDLPCAIVPSWTATPAHDGDTLVVNADTGKTFRANLTEKGRKAADKEKEAKDLARREIVRAYRRRLKDAIVENLPKRADVEAFRALARLLTDWDQSRAAEFMGWPNEEFAERLDRAEEREVINLLFLRGVAECLRSDADPVESPYVYDGQMTPAETLAKTLGLNPAAIKKAVEAELKPDSGANPKPRKGEKPEAGS